MSDILLQTQGLGVSFGGVHAVRDVDFRLERGEIRCLIGPNGAGKSTFFKMLSGQLRPSRRHPFQGPTATRLPTHEVARLGIGIKTQVPSVFEGLDVRENLLLAAARRRGADGPAAIADQILAQTGLGDVAAAPVNTLAHGQRQWVELGMILASRPELVLLDEPAAGMTHQEVRKTADMIRAINRHSTVVVVEHDMAFIRLIAGRITVFNQGQILAEGGYDDIMAHADVRAAYLGKQESSMLKAHDLNAGYGRIPVLRGVRLNMAPGEFTGILGRNGMGKTTCCARADGRTAADRGSLALDGRDIGGLAPHARARQGLGYVPQGRQIFPALTVAENLRMGCVKRLRDADAKIAQVLQVFPACNACWTAPAAACPAANSNCWRWPAVSAASPS